MKVVFELIGLVLQGIGYYLIGRGCGLLFVLAVCLSVLFGFYALLALMI
jgi:hypothetical protein